MWSIFPDSAIFPSKSNNLLVFFLIHLSIKQFPGPTSLAKIFPSLLINVSFDIPPMFKNVADFFFVSLNKSLWNMGVRGAP